MKRCALVASVLLLVCLSASAAISYGAPTFPATGSGPIAIVVADLNGDCNPDFATANFAAGSATIRFGDGAGGFLTAHTISGLSDPESIAAGDFNGDGSIDLAIGNAGSFSPLLNTLQIYLNDGAGNFTLQPGTLTASSRAHALIAADFNGDGHLDLIAPDPSGSGTGVLYFAGHGDGTFAAGVHIDVIPSPSSDLVSGLVAADINGDGHLDLASANAETMSVLYGNGNGTFGAPVVFNYTSPDGAVDVTAGDINNDGRIDLATAGGNFPAGATVFINLGGGAFSRSQFQMPLAPANPISVTLADMDGDGNLDIVTADQYGCTPWGSNLAARPGNGNGTFGAAQPISIGYGPTCIDSHWQPNVVAAVDLNCDGKMDLISANLNVSFVSVMLTSGGSAPTPTITAPPAVSVPSTASCSAVVSDAQLGAATAHDSCSCVVVTRTGVPAGNLFPAGTTIVTYTATAHGLSASATQNVTVTDTTAPSVTAPADVIASAGPSCTATVSLGTATASDDCGSVTTSPSFAGPFGVGMTTVIWTALDSHGNSATANQTVTVNDNTPPSITAPPDITLTSCSTSVALGVPITSDNCAGVTTSATRSDGQPIAAPFAFGATTVTWTALDAHGNSVSATQTVTLNAPPVVIGTATAAPNALWPPDHKMIDIAIGYTTSGGCGTISCGIASITSNEPLNMTGDGNTSSDWQIVDAHHVRLRAERSGNGNGRVYTINIVCGGATRSVTVTVKK